MIFRAVEDADLIRKARRGDVEAYNLLISRWEKRVYNYLLRIVGDREDALDLSQDVFLKAYQNLRKLDDPARFAGAWNFGPNEENAVAVGRLVDAEPAPVAHERADRIRGEEQGSRDVRADRGLGER